MKHSLVSLVAWFLAASYNGPVTEAAHLFIDIRRKDG